jgi:hypothetical protein
MSTTTSFATPPAKEPVLNSDGTMSQAWVSYFQSTSTTAAQFVRSGSGSAKTAADAAQTDATTALSQIVALTLANTWAVGDYRPSAAATLGPDWLECDGSDVASATYPDLYTAIGSITGPGAGAGTFKLPGLEAIFDVASPGPAGPPILRWYVRALA